MWRENADFNFTGHGFTDGALKGGGPGMARRAGWAAILADEEGQIVAGIYGPCAETFPSSQRAELTAVIRMLELALPPLVIWVDNQGVVDCWHNGEEWCCASSRPTADLWRVCWRLIVDIGAECLSVKKCKGHATIADVEAGRATKFTMVGNDNADHYAVQGALIAEHQAPL